MSDLISAAKQALEALETCMYPQQKQFQAITALRQAIEQAEKQEPVIGVEVKRIASGGFIGNVWWIHENLQEGVFHLYTHQQPKREPPAVEFGMHGEKMMFKIGVQQFTLDYEPDTQDEFNFMRDMLIKAFSTFTHDVKTHPKREPLTDEQIAEISVECATVTPSVCGQS